MGQCEMSSIIGDKRMCELAVLGEVLHDLSLDELISYNGWFPLWKRIVVAIRTIRVSPIGVLRSLFVQCPFQHVC